MRANLKEKWGRITRMKRFTKIAAGVMSLTMLLSFCSCSSHKTHSGREYSDEESKPELRTTEVTVPPDLTEPTEPSDVSDPTKPTPTPAPTYNRGNGITDMTMFIALVGSEKNYDNEICEIIAEKTGVRVTESYLTGITTDEAIDTIIASGQYPDFIYAGSESYKLYENGSLVAWDPYLEIYPELKALYSDDEWDMFRQDDGHIYWANVFENHYGKNTETVHNGCAFWIQVRVLEWAGYPEIETLDQYFELLEKYTEANPEMPDGSAVIPYTTLCESWRYYSIECAPMYLDGYPNEGSAIVNIDDGPYDPVVVDYNTIDTAQKYFKKLNEEYNKGMIDPDFATQNYDEYIAKLSTGRVLGMCDYYWDFAYSLMGEYTQYRTASDGSTYTLSDIGCDYVPLGLVAEEGMSQQWHAYEEQRDYSSGTAVTIGCIDPDLAFKFMNDLLSQEVHDLRFWGVEGKDYFVDDAGLFYRTPEMRANWIDSSFEAMHTCEYSYLPNWHGMSRDGINRMRPEEQPSEYKSSLPEAVVRCFEAYDADNYVEFIGSEYVERMPWTPLYTWSNNLTQDTMEGRVWQAMGECKHKWLPQLVMSKDFDSTWKKYQAEYYQLNIDAFIDAAQEEVYRRLNDALEKGWSI